MKSCSPQPCRSGLSLRVLAILTPLLFFQASWILSQETTPSSTQPESEAGPSASDLEILSKAATLSDDELENFYVIYRRLENANLAGALLAEAAKRSPELAQRLKDAALRIDPGKERIDTLITQKKYVEAIAEMEKLRAEQGDEFAFDRELAESYGAMDRESQARAAWQRVLARDDASDEDRKVAQAQLKAMDMRGEIRQAYVKIRAKQYDEALAMAERAEARYPGEPEVALLKRDAILGKGLESAYGLIRQKRFDEARAAADALAAKYPSARDVKILQHDIVISAAAEEVYALMRMGKREESLTRAEELRETWPQEPEILIAHAQAMSYNWRFEEAYLLLGDLRKKYYPTGHFPGESALGDIYTSQGDYPSAIAAHRRALTNPDAEPRDILEAERTIVDLERMEKSLSSSGVEFRNEGEGDATIYRSEYSHFLNSDQRLGVRSYFHDVSLVPGLLVPTGGETWGASAYFHQRLGSRHFVEARLGGGSFDEVSAGITLGLASYHQSQPSLEIYGDVNRASLDSLQPIALDAVEDVIGLRGSRMINPRLVLYAEASVRRVSAQEVDLGDGQRAFIEVKQTLAVDARETTGIYLAYRGRHERFDGELIPVSGLGTLGISPAALASGNPGENFYEAENDSHGLVLSGQLELTRNLSLYGSSAALFDFADEDLVYEVETALTWRMSDNADFQASFGYFSEGAGAANETSASYVGTLGIQIYF